MTAFLLKAETECYQGFQDKFIFNMRCFLLTELLGLHAAALNFRPQNSIWKMPKDYLIINCGNSCKTVCKTINKMIFPSIGIASRLKSNS
ncbi:hypothetical protein D7V32_16090 [Acinetobacter tianfuensis]|uniref:Uncharacterized protein n=1 Tax=Acinetobacter tianfuensis TaxID=2419603 RepID=A0A3A8E1Y5_9GAMM|nr:hypothetical protein D7V32_16090 [Acinetobacter tianfuensis]